MTSLARWLILTLALLSATAFLLPLLTAVAACVYVVRRHDGHPLLLLPVLAYAVGVGVFLLVHWSYRYGQQYYWLGWLSANDCVKRAPWFASELM